MKALMKKFWQQTINDTRKVLDVISLLLGWFLFSVAIGAGLTFGCLLAIIYLIYGN